ncbi:DUF1906 domain-containing protein [Paenibacillus sp. 2RAB27]|uniref:DUF1906 domain-containing protein n=1 Tax=Paenibacillus sp. 2RAB27 TaxID=3232991 RepID=UPI003F9D7905
MTKGIDCATPLTTKTAAAFALGGFSFAARYLVPSGWKALTKTEADIINQAGMDIVSVFETTADRALGGRAAGLADGATAVKVAQKVGQPAGSCIYFAVDFEATKAQMATVIEYIRAASEATPEYTTGVYGSFAVIEAISKAGACSRFWQTRAWSYNKKSAAANIYQYDCGPQGLGLTMNGIGVDLNEGYGNEGAWNNLKEEDEIMLKVEDADKLIEVLSKIYAICIDQVSKDEVHRLANELRKASGQPIE